MAFLRTSSNFQGFFEKKSVSKSKSEKDFAFTFKLPTFLVTLGFRQTKLINFLEFPGS